MSTGVGHLACPSCGAYIVSRLFVAPLRMDTCECLACGAVWDEDAQSGERQGQADRSSVLARRFSS